MSALKRSSGMFPDYVKISDKGVLHVDVARLLKTPAAKRQLEAVQRLQRRRPVVRQRKIA
jgi:hypothetical protein